MTVPKIKQDTVITILLAIAGSLFMLLWNQQQGIILDLSNRVYDLGVMCKG